jgi:hypothetical protein
MTVSTEKLVRMAEQITANMNYGEPTEIVAAKVADHINKFWDERMTSEFKVYARNHEGELSIELQAAIPLLN